MRATGNDRKAATLDLLDALRQVYVNRGRRVLLQRLLAGELATADDIRASVELPPNIDPVCFGAVPLPLVRAGIIRRSGFVTTSRPEAHARPVSVWTLLDRTKALQWLNDHPDPGPPDEKNTRQPQLPGMELR